jgi:hypothetical protein
VTRARPKLTTSQIVLIVLAGLFAVALLAGSIWAMSRRSVSSLGSPDELDEPRWSDTGPPRVGDYWHAAYGIWVCNGFEPVGAGEPSPDLTGIYTRGDGLIHIRPTEPSYAGRNATLALFADSIGLDVSPEALYLPDGGVRDTCDGRAARVTVWRWDADDLSKPPEQLGHDLWTIRFTKNREVYVIALNPEDAPPPPLPRSIDSLPKRPSTTGTTRRPATTIRPAPGTTAARDSTGQPLGLNLPLNGPPGYAWEEWDRNRLAATGALADLGVEPSDAETAYYQRLTKLDGSGTTLTGIVWDFRDSNAAQRYAERIAAAAASGVEAPFPDSYRLPARRWIQPDRVVILARHGDLVMVTVLRGHDVNPEESVLYSTFLFHAIAR